MNVFGRVYFTIVTFAIFCNTIVDIDKITTGDSFFYIVIFIAGIFYMVSDWKKD